MSLGLATSDIVNVQVSLPPVAAALRNFGNLLILGASPVVDVVERIRTYSDLAAIATDFGTGADEYKAAAKFFSQSPTPASVQIGRWAKTASAAVIHGGPLSTDEQAVAEWTDITTGSMRITIDGVVKNLAGLNFSAVGNMNAVAAVINAGLGVAGTCVWNAAYSRFDITSATTGAASTITYAEPTGAGVDISAQTKLTAATGAVAPVNGVVAESLIDAVTTVAGKSNNWYGLYVATAATTADHEAVAAFIEAATPSRIYGITTQDPNVLNAAATTDIAYKLKAAGYKRTFTQYSSTDAHAAASIFGRTFTVDFSGNNTAITVKFKTEPGVVPETLTATQAAAAAAKNCNVFVNYNNSTAIIQQGVMSNGFYFDEVHGLDWLQDRLQTDIFNLLYTSDTKIPQTDAGVNFIVTTASQSCEAGVNNGLLAPGQWNGPAIGALKPGQTLAKGYYVYAPPVASQSAADRAARKAPTLQIAAKLAGAVHFANVVVNVNR